MLEEHREYTPEFAVSLAAMMGLCGGVVALLIGFYEPDFVPSAAKGAALAGFGTSGMFGRGGERGAVWAGLGAILATLFGAGLGAAMLENDWRAAPLGLFLVVSQLASEPVVLAVWLVAMCTIQHCALRLRRAA